MIPLLRAECRKLLTVRSTYIICGLALLLVGFFSFYIEGYRGIIVHPDWSWLVTNVSTLVAMFAAIVAILLMGHEYRHNTITYTLTAANSRTKVLLAKLLMVVAFCAVFTVVALVWAALAYRVGVALSPNELLVWSTPQFIWDDAWRGLFFVISMGQIGLLLAFLFRNLVGAIAALFILPTVEGLLSPLLKQNATYLPFSLLDQVHNSISWNPVTAAWLFVAYLAGLWLLAWYLFMRRDAN